VNEDAHPRTGARIPNSEKHHGHLVPVDAASGERLEPLTAPRQEHRGERRLRHRSRPVIHNGDVGKRTKSAG
jgi:hypothetical protein